MQNAGHYHQHTAHGNGRLKTDEQHGTFAPTHSLYRCLYETSEHHKQNGKPQMITICREIFLLQLSEYVDGRTSQGH